MPNDRDGGDGEGMIELLGRSARAGVLLGLSLVLFGACGTTEMNSPACGADGCIDGLHVILEGDLPAQFTIEVHDVQRDVVVSRECDAMSCVEVFFEGFTPEEVQIDIVDVDGTTSATFRPDYERSMAGCATVCHLGQIRMTIEE